MLTWMRKHPGPIYTSRKHPDYPGLVEFPLEAVINSCGHAYFNNTAAYAVAYATHIGVKRLSMFGCDYTYPNAHDAEKGRACTEFHLGIFAERNRRRRPRIVDPLGVPCGTSLLDSICTEQERMYGYDTLDLAVSGGHGKPTVVKFTPRENIPTADEIEARYDHSKHPSPLVKENTP
jgi:hypothetical protein